MKTYRKRVLDATIEERLQSKGALLIEGPKWCGKTTTAEHHAKSTLMLAQTEKLHLTRQLLEVDSASALKGDSPLLIDEWQELPQIWDAVRYEVDHRGRFGQFILTGSAVPTGGKGEKPLHSGIGRFAWLTLRPMTLWESGESNGGVSLGVLFTAPERLSAESGLKLPDIAYLICRGGWPGALGLSKKAALEQAYDYVDAVTREDVIRVDGVKRASSRITKLMRAYARHQGTQATIRTIRDDVKGNEPSSLDEETIASDLDALRKIFVIEDVEAWNPNLRSKTAIRSTATRYFVDPSIAAAALDLGPSDLMDDLNTLGLLFETLCIRDLRTYAEALKGRVFHYRDQSGLECDAVVYLRGGSYGLIEIKLGGQTAIEAGAHTLTALAERIDTDKMKAPSFRMVLTAVGDLAYRRSDGVYVVPVGCLTA